ncbi:MAG: DUF120 domain-containing protein [Candidatus Hadarchaeales archaeon]
MKTEKLLLLLARLGGCRREVRVSLSSLARETCTSKQTVGRELEKLQRDGLITRSYSPDGQRIKLTQAGVAKLKNLYRQLQEIFEKRRPQKFAGEIVSGLGEGSYYMRQPGYVAQIMKALGFAPYPGTLDVRLGDGAVKEIKELPGIEISGFTTKERSFGGAKLYPAKLGKVNGAIIFPLRSHHQDIAEFIAPNNIRQSLKLKDGDIVEIEVVG